MRLGLPKQITHVEHGQAVDLPDSSPSVSILIVFFVIHLINAARIRLSGRLFARIAFCTCLACSFTLSSSPELARGLYRDIAKRVDSFFLFVRQTGLYR